MVAVAAVAVFGTDRTEAVVSADLANDLELVASSSLELAPVGPGASVISATERVEKPAQRLTPSPARTRAPKAPPPEVVAVSEAADEGPTVAETVIAASPADDAELETPAPEAPTPPAVPRPRPVEPRFPVGEGPTAGDGRDGYPGGGIGTIVIRGGRTGRDDCAIHDRRRGSRPAGIHISINQRMPPVNPTFPTSGPTFPRR
jgi:hypothetical protein